MRKWNRLYLSFALLLLCATMQAQELRLGAGAEFAAQKQVFNGEVQWRKDMFESSHSVLLMQLGATHRLNNYCRIGADYRYSTGLRGIYTESNIDYLSRHRVAVELKLYTKRFDNDIRMSNNFSYQLQIREDKRIRNYLRNEIVVDYRITRVFKPFVGAEVFYSMSERSFPMMRFCIGADLSFGKHGIEAAYKADYFLKSNNRAEYIMQISYVFELTSKP